MAVLISLLTIVAVSLLCVRIGTIALVMTGLSRDVAAFQAQSAFSGVGFTTAEAEAITSHPVRRRIVRILMLIGTAGITSTVAALVVAFTQATERGHVWQRLGLVALGVGALFGLSKLPVFNRALNWLIQRALAAATGLRLQDYEALLQVGEGYSVAQVPVSAGHWLAERSLRDVNLTAEGIIVISIRRRRGHVFSAPSADTVIRVGDDVICYGREEKISALAGRKRDARGEEEHKWSMERQRLDREEEITEDRHMTQEALLPEGAKNARPEDDRKQQGQDTSAA